MRLNTSKTPNEFTNLCSKGRLKEAFESFTSEIWSDPSLFSPLSLLKHLHSLIITSGSSSEKFVANHLLNAYAKIGELSTAVTLFDVMPRKNIMSCNILIGGFIQNGDLESARQVFDEMPKRNVATWNAMVAGMTQFEFNEEGLSLFSQMHGLGFMLDEFTLGSVLRGCAGLKDLNAGWQVHGYVVKCGFEFNLVVGSSLAHMYMKSGSLGEGERVIKAMPIRNVVACNTLIAGRAQNGFSEGGLDQYNMMKMAGFRPDKITFVSVISSCSELATLGQGQQIHAEAIKTGASTVVGVISSLISMYSRCGCLDESVKAFLEREEANVVLWSSMIAAYGFHGKEEEAIELFNRMDQVGLDANDVTFLSLLYACSHCGLKDKGLQFFNLMIEKYGLEPRLEHYTCLVDLLGRSGCLEEAEGFIRTMPAKKDAIIWKTLLSACKIHKNADIAKRIAEEVLRLDPQDSAPYVLLSNIQASAKRWQDVSEVRKVVRDRRVKKEPGISWFEVKNQVHQFCMCDKSHPQSMEIDMYLKELTWEMKLQGYVPDTGSVLHDMDTEEKEHNLAHHSEKLAIAFALMNTPEGFPIRVMKNLRVCSDCHVAIKQLNNHESNLLKKGSVEFVCGFYCFGSCTYYLFSVAIVGGGNHSVGWSTNVGHPVKEGATLQLTVDGELALRNSDGDHVWSTNTLGKSVVGMNMTEWKNLVLFNNERAIVWQSFDYPTNTLLVGQQLYEDQKLISSSSNLWARGLYFATLKFVTDCATYIGGKVNHKYIISSDDGHLKIFHHSNANGWREIVDMITHDLGECQHPSHCGEYGLCRQGQCSCPIGIDWVRYFEQHRAKMENISNRLSFKYPLEMYNNNVSDGYSCVATEDFKERLGGGAFGTVCKGMLEDGTQIAAKRLDKLGQGMKEFFAEVETLGHIHHANLVRLIGFCAKKAYRLLVYEYMTNGSLDSWIFWDNQRPCLNWQAWKKIILHIEKGLAYLHEECRETLTAHSQNLENICFKCCRRSLSINYMVENMDEGVKQYHAEEVVRMIKIGAWCLQNDQSRRPSMSIVVKVLEGLMEVDTNVNYNFTYATASSSTINSHASTAPPASVLSNP
ncbi:unnamed protein product [Camellia sinensis]